MLLQGYCLIKAIATRRISLMRRRDLQEETGQPVQLLNDDADEDQLFMSGMFGGLIQVPLPIPEILSSLDRSKYQEVITERLNRRKM